MKQIIEMSDVEELKNMLEGAFDKARFDAILAKYVNMVPWLVLDLPPYAPIFRGREMKGDDLLYLDRRELSYPPAEYAPIGRVSYEHHPMFYGSIIPGAKGGGYLPWVTIVGELEIFKGEDIRKDVTFGIWDAGRQLRLAALPFSNKYKLGLVDEIVVLQKEWEDKVKPHMTKEEIEIATFFSDLLVELGNPKLFQFTAGFFEYYLNHSEEGKELDGIFYPSAPSEGKGLNVCLRPEVADMLWLKAATYAMFYRAQNGEMYRVVYLDADTNSHPWKWRTDPFNGADKLPEPLRKRYVKDDAQFKADVKAAGYNRGRTKLVRNKTI